MADISDKLSVALVANEVDELHKQGGLGDYVGSFARTLNDMGHDVRIFMPAYSDLDLSGSKPLFEVEVDGAMVDVHEFSLEGGVKAYAIAPQLGKQEERISRPIDLPPSVYTSSINEEQVKYVLLTSRAVLDVVEVLSKQSAFNPDIFHCNEWTTAPVAFFLGNEKEHRFADSSVVYTIHNNEYKGKFSEGFGNTPAKVVFKNLVSMFGLGDIRKRQLNKIIEAYDSVGNINLADAGKLFAHAVNTVSPSYGREIGFQGILNGLDEHNWDPRRVLNVDEVNRRNLGEVMMAKMAKKKVMQERYGLEPNPNAIVISYLHRYCNQKHTAEVAKIVPLILAHKGVQFVARGDGHMGLYLSSDDYGNMVDDGRASIMNRFVGKDQEELIYAASDIFLMPSSFEPCGYSQMKAMTAGAVPIVNPVGGLKDTVTAYGPANQDGTGLVVDLGGVFFSGKVVEYKLLSKVFDAIMMKNAHPEIWEKLVGNCISQNFNWNQGGGKGPIHQYISLYRKAMDMKTIEAE